VDLDRFPLPTVKAKDPVGFGDHLPIALLLMHERRLTALQLPLLLLRLLKADSLDPYSCQIYDHASLVLMSIAKAKQATGTGIKDAIRAATHAVGGKVVDNAVDGIKAINAGLSVSPQILPDDVAAIAAAGFRSVVCNRPDGEGADQPAFAAIEAAARAAGLQAAYLPVVSGQVKDADVEAVATLFATLPKPVFAYCRSGTRSATLWSLAKPQMAG
jgi:uncharacterized protein (TIGR01244 family)